MQKKIFHARSQNQVIDTLILLQHPPTYTFGRQTQAGQPILSDETFMLHGSTKDHENPLPLIPSHKGRGNHKYPPPLMGGGEGEGEPGFSDEKDIEHADIYWVDRGGGATYHGPGQLVGYPIIGLKSYTTDFHAYLRMLEDVMIRTVGDFHIYAERVKGYTGVWVDGAKIGSIGVRIIKGFTMHGFSLNVNNDLAPFNKIVPCNIRGVKMTSMSKVSGTEIDILEVEKRLVSHFAAVFGVLPMVMIFNHSPCKSEG